MPNPADYKDEESFVHACVRIVMKEGKTQDEALGQCYGMWRDHKKKNGEPETFKARIA